MARTVTLNAKEVVIDREKLRGILDEKEMNFSSFYEQVTEAYGLDIRYQHFLTLLQNKVSWKLIYAWAVAESLGLEIPDLFYLVDVDIQQKIIEREQWKEKYNKS